LFPGEAGRIHPNLSRAFAKKRRPAHFLFTVVYPSKWNRTRWLTLLLLRPPIVSSPALISAVVGSLQSYAGNHLNARITSVNSIAWRLPPDMWRKWDSAGRQVDPLPPAPGRH